MRLIPLLTTLGLAVLLTGCSAMKFTATPSSLSGLAVQGIAHGGQGPIYGGHVYLFAANATAYGRSSLSLLSTLSTGHSDSTGAYVLTDQDGNFSITGDYTCAQGTQIYLLITSGSTDGNINDINPYISLMTILGECPSTTLSSFAATIPFLNVNEVTTVAAAYAIAGYAVDATHVSSDANQLNPGSHPLAASGIEHAFSNFFNLAEPSTGSACTNTASVVNGNCLLSPNANGAAPSDVLNSIANSLAYCVNSTGSTCSTLFNDITSLSGAHPVDTATAALYLAQNPGQGGSTNVKSIYDLGAGVGAPFVGRSTTPADLSLGLVFTGNGLAGPYALGIDASGNVWSANTSGSSVSIFTPFGAAATTANSIFTSDSPLTGNSLVEPLSIAFDASGNAWVGGGSNSSNVSIFTSTGAVATTSNSTLNSPVSSSGLQEAEAIAIDTRGNAWVGYDVLSSAPKIAAYTPTGGTLPGSPFFSNNISFLPYGLAIDLSGNVWITDNQEGELVVLNSTGAVSPSFNGSPYEFTNGLNSSREIAIDASGNAWIANGGSVSIFTSTGAAATTTNSTVTAHNSPITGNGLSSGSGLAIDGAGSVWVSSRGAVGASEFSSTGAGLSPVRIGSAYLPSNAITFSVAIDGSGNVWLADEQTSRLLELVGSASPVVTPIVANMLSPYDVKNSAVNKP